MNIAYDRMWIYSDLFCSALACRPFCCCFCCFRRFNLFVSRAIYYYTFASRVSCTAHVLHHGSCVTFHVDNFTIFSATLFSIMPWRVLSRAPEHLYFHHQSVAQSRLCQQNRFIFFFSFNTSANECEKNKKKKKIG